MHGRLKVKTSAQEQEERRKEREQKLKIYRAGFEAVFHKRKIGDYDEEVLHITKQLLCSNPDIYTLWNVRRESLKLLCETKSQEEYLEEELRVTETALRSNPKSYGAWHHRMWVLQAMQNPPLTQDLILCSKLLKADPRNFHCWDYRRWLSICMGSGNKVQMELEFSLDKLTDNFSNYSAWHYRTLFLPVVHMDDNAPCSITPIQHKRELELVQNAVFTDPGDQSAWFYLRWLLGKGSACKPQLRMGTLKCSEGHVISASLVLTVAEKASKRDEKPWLRAQLRVGKCMIKGHWKCSGSLKCSHIWTFTPDPADHEIIVSDRGGEGADVDVKVCDLPSIALIECGEDIDELYLKLEVHPGDQSGTEEWVGRREVNETTGWDSDGEHFGKGLVTPLLEEQLELCTQLLDLEPDSRWALLTAVQLMRTLKKRHAQQKVSSYHVKIMDYLDKLKKVDPLRCGFYSDLRSDCILDTALSSSCSSVIDLSSLGLTALPSPLVPLPFPLLMATKIDLSANPILTLPTLRPGSLACLAHLPRLCHLRLGTSFPKLATESSMQNILPQLPQLLHLELVSDDANASTSIPKVIVNILYELMPALQSLKPV